MAIVFHKDEALANTGLPEELVRFHEDDLPANSRSFCFAHAGKVCVDQTISHLVGHTLWDAGLVLAYYLDQTYSLANRKVLELGAGTGLVGIVAAALGAEVVLTDQTSVIDQTRKNIRQNAAQIEAGGGAAECLAGRYSAEEQMPDPDLGRAVKAGWCNVTTDKRSFGCPSVRSDIKKPARRSVSDSQNYGDDVSAHTLVQPPQYGHLGVEDEAFFEPLSKQEIREMFAAIGYVLADGDFAEVWRSACGDSTRCSVQGFQMSLNEHLDNARA